MGIDVHGARFLFHARKLGVDFERTATIGRQGIFLTATELRDVASAFSYTLDAQDSDCIFGGSDGLAEGLLKYLGAASVHSFDISSYEGATHLQDMNREIPKTFFDQYSVVIDGGSLEHVFNFPQAIKNCMEIVRVGGHYLGITPANNFFGHGFYQFSPELYFSVFDEANGFEVTSMIAFEDKRDSDWYSVRRPSEVGGRVTLCNSAPVFLLIVAKKIARKTIFETAPQQSDYAAIWREANLSDARRNVDTNLILKSPALIRFAKMVVPKSLRKLIRNLLERPSEASAGFESRFFRRIDPAARTRPSTK